MVLLLLRDGRVQELYDCEDVVHKPGYLICLDYHGSPYATFSSGEILAYTQNPQVARAVREAIAWENGRIVIDSSVLAKWWNRQGRGPNAGAPCWGNALLP